MKPLHITSRSAVLPCVLLHKVVFPLTVPLSVFNLIFKPVAFVWSKRLHYLNCLTATLVSVTNFRIRWQKTDTKPKGLPAFTNKTRQTFCCQTPAFCTHCNTLLHTVFISECFQLVVPAMIFVEMFALPQPIGNEIASVTNFRIRWQKNRQKAKRACCFCKQNKADVLLSNVCLVYTLQCGFARQFVRLS